LKWKREKKEVQRNARMRSRGIAVRAAPRDPPGAEWTRQNSSNEAASPHESERAVKEREKAGARKISASDCVSAC